MKNFFIALSDNRSSLFIQHCPNLCMSVFSLFPRFLLGQTPQFDRSFRVERLQETDSEHFSSFECHRKIDHYCFASQQVSLCYRLQLQGISQAGCEGSVVVEGELPVDIAGSCEVELFSVHEVQVLLGLITCEGCLVVRSGHGPQAEVAQGVGPGPLVEL